MAIKIKNKKGVTSWVEDSRVAGFVKRGFVIVEEAPPTPPIIPPIIPPEDEEEDENEEYRKDLELMTVAELYEMASQLELDPKKRDTKGDLVKALLENDSE